jgi:glycosyltransferase involved in cell wall biosynthesis
MQENNVMISIVVPSYNRADLIANTLTSLQKIEYENYEIIVVDDGSTDNTEEIVKSIAGPKTRYIKKNNAERAAARNFGAGLAKGEYINFFDSDDLALPNHLSEAASMIKKYKIPEWFHMGFAWCTPEGEVFKKVDNYSGKTLNAAMAKGNRLSCNSVFIRKDIILKFPFNEDRALSASEDYELWLRLTARFPLYYSNVITSWIVDHELRSVRKINGEKLIKRLELLIHYLRQDDRVLQFFGSDFKKIKADSHSYVALHLAEQPAFKIKSIKYLLHCFSIDPKMISSKRFYAILKNLLIKWQGS